MTHSLSPFNKYVRRKSLRLKTGRRPTVALSGCGGGQTFRQETHKQERQKQGREWTACHFLTPPIRCSEGCALVGLTCRLSQGSSSTQRPNAGVCLWAYQAFPDGDLSAWREREEHWKGKGSGEEWRWVYEDETDSTLGVKNMTCFFTSLSYCCTPFLSPMD